jgi:hypothetical protein
MRFSPKLAGVWFERSFQKILNIKAVRITGVGEENFAKVGKSFTEHSTQFEKYYTHTHTVIPRCNFTGGAQLNFTGGPL